jgi:hypothetical protein
MPVIVYITAENGRLALAGRESHDIIRLWAGRPIVSSSSLHNLFTFPGVWRCHMSIKSMIKCNCGQRILAKDVMQTGYYLRLFGPSFVYVKFRCSRCKKLGEQFVKQEEWEDGILHDIPSEMGCDEKQKFDDMGKIGIHECIDAHFELEKLSNLRDALEQSKS